MRVADRMITNTTLNNISRSLNSLNNYSIQASSGKKIQNPSDDPIISSRSLRYRTIVSETKQYLENVSQANAWVEITESTLNNINSIIQNMRELCVKGASDTYTTEDRQKIYTEFSSLLEQLETELNTTYMGRYIFSGYLTNTSPIIQNEEGNNILNPDIYGDGELTNVDGQYINVAIGSATTIPINSLITTIYDPSDYEALHSMDELFASLDLLEEEGIEVEEEELDADAVDVALAEEADAVAEGAEETEEAEDETEKISNQLRDAFESMISILDNYMAKISVEHTKVGVKINKLELIDSRLTDDQINYTSLQSENEDIDIAEVTINYNSANAAYTAALKIGATINQITLADYL